MKPVLFLICSLSMSGILYCQDYHPIVQDDNEWNVLKVIGYPWVDTTYWTMTYKISGDTIISNNPYKKIYISEQEIPANWDYAGGMREEGQKVWYWRPYENEEWLLYDFDVNVGDTVPIPYCPMIVDSIASIQINDETRKHIFLSLDGQGEIIENWIEGIGSNYGILQSGGYLIVGWRTWFLCMSEDGELIYMNPTFNSCSLINTVINESSTPRFQVYPNPANDKVVIENIDNINIESISLIDLNGKVLLNLGKDAKELDLSGFVSGVYILKLTLEDREISRRIIIE